MDSTTSQWSELCHTNPSVAVAYYLSRVFPTGVVGVDRDVVREVVGVVGCGRNEGSGIEGRCDHGVGEFFASIGGGEGMGCGRFLPGGGGVCRVVSRTVESCAARGVCERVGDDGVCDGAGCGETATSVESLGARRLRGCGGAAEEVDAGGCDGDGNVDAGSGGVSQGVSKGPGASEVLRGRHYEKNKAKRERMKRKQREVERSQEKNKLQKSAEEKWEAQNRLATMEAERKIALLEARDLEQEKRTDRVRIQRNLERNMVAIEKTHATLRATGNVPGEMGFCETIVGSGSISPDSSASQADIRAMKKELEDGKAEIANLRSLLGRNGIPEVDVALYDKHSWTQNEDNFELLDKLYPGGYALNDLYASDGKARVVPC